MKSQVFVKICIMSICSHKLLQHYCLNGNMKQSIIFILLKIVMCPSISTVNLKTTAVEA